MIPPRSRRRICRTISLRRLEVRPEHRLLEVLLADVLARVHVDGDERLGLVDDDVAARLEPDLRLQRLGDLRLDAELVEDRLVAAVEADARDELRLDLVEELDDALVLVDRVDPDALELRREHVADRAQDEIEIVMDRRSARRTSRRAA